MKKLIIGVTGFNGSGKGLISEVIPKFFENGTTSYFSVSSFISEFLQNKDFLREDFRKIANNYREENGGDFWIRKIIERARTPIIVIESIRCEDEVEFIKQHNDNHKGILIGVIADGLTRYKRIKNRGEMKDRDHIDTFPDFLNQERVENDNTESWKQNVNYCLSNSDFLLENHDFSEDPKISSASKRQLIRDALDLLPQIFERLPEFKAFYAPKF